MNHSLRNGDLNSGRFFRYGGLPWIMRHWKDVGFHTVSSTYNNLPRDKSFLARPAYRHVISHMRRVQGRSRTNLFKSAFYAEELNHEFRRRSFYTVHL